MSYTPSNNEKDSGISVTIERPRRDLQPKMERIEDVDSDHSITPVTTRHQQHQLLDPSDPTNPFSPFYEHAQARTLLSLQEPPMSKQSTKVSSSPAYDSDLEACWTESKSNMLDAKKTTTKDCSVWPGQKALKDAKRAEKLRRRGSCWNPMRGLEPKTKFWLKVLIAAIIVGAATGIGLGISKAVGAGIWRPQDH